MTWLRMQWIAIRHPITSFRIRRMIARQ